VQCGRSIPMSISTRADQRTHPIFGMLPALVVVLMAGCTMGPSGDNGGSDSTESPEAPPTSAAPTGSADCINPGGGCLGTLEAGTHPTTEIQPGFSYTVSDGWQQVEDTESSFFLLAPGEAVDEVFAGTATLMFVLSPAFAAARTCDTVGEPEIERSIDAVLAYLAGRTDVELSEPEPIEIGGLSGVSFGATQVTAEGLQCPGLEDEAWTPVIAGFAGTQPTASGPLEGTTTRYALLEHDDGLIAVGIEHDGAEEDPVMDEAAQIVESIEFDL
jgi:hypothetical protein